MVFIHHSFIPCQSLQRVIFQTHHCLFPWCQWIQLCIQVIVRLGSKTLSVTLSFFSVKGLSFNPNAINKSKDLNVLLKDSCLKNHKNFVILPGVINNTISAHHSNNTPYPVDDLVNTLKKLKPRIAGIVYCRREGLRDIRAEL